MRRNIRDRVRRLRHFSPSIPIRTSSSARTAACRGCGRVHDLRHVSVRAALRPGPASASTTSATASKWSSTPTTARRRSTCSTTRTQSSRRTGALSDAVQGCERDAAGSAQTRAVSRTVAEDAGGRLRPVSHGLARGVLQPRGSVDGGEPVSQGSQGEQATQPMEPNFVLMKLPGESSPSSSRSCRSRRPTGTT